MSEGQRERSDEKLGQPCSQLAASGEVGPGLICTALNSSLNGVLIADPRGRIVYVNPAFLRMFEYGDEAEVVGRNAGDLFVARGVERLADVKAAIDAAGEETLEFNVRRRDGSVFPVEAAASSVIDDAGHVVGRMASFVDVSARKEMEKQLMRREKLALLGQMAGGIVHELRNPLGWIKGSTYFLETSLQEPGADVAEAIELLKRGVTKSEKIIDGLLNLAQPASSKRREVDVNVVLRKALSDIELPENVRVNMQLDESLPAVRADPDQLGLVFDNVILNAIQAMREGGTLTLTTEASEGWVAVSFADSGVGISEEDLERIFEPLFTTKPGGIGLGLALIKMLVEEHGGRIEVESEVGEGSVFTVSLPANNG